MRRCQERRALARSVPLGLCLIARKLVSSQARSSFGLVALINSSSLPRRNTRSVYRESELSFHGSVVAFYTASDGLRVT